MMKTYNGRKERKPKVNMGSWQKNFNRLEVEFMKFKQEMFIMIRKRDASVHDQNYNVPEAFTINGQLHDHNCR